MNLPAANWKPRPHHPRLEYNVESGKQKSRETDASLSHGGNFFDKGKIYVSNFFFVLQIWIFIRWEANWIILGAVVYTEAKGERSLKMSIEERMGQGKRIKDQRSEKEKCPNRSVG